MVDPLSYHLDANGLGKVRRMYSGGGVSGMTLDVCSVGSHVSGSVSWWEDVQQEAGLD